MGRDENETRCRGVRARSAGCLDHRLRVAAQAGVSIETANEPLDCVDSGIACHHDAAGINPLAPQIVGIRGDRREMQAGDRCDQLAVHFLRPGRVDVAGTQPRFHMGDRYLLVERGERCRKSGRRVALDDEPVGTLLLQPPAKRVAERSRSAR